MTSQFNFLKQFLKSSQSLLFFGTLVFYFFSMQYPIHEHAGFRVLNAISLFLSVSSLFILFRKAFINSLAINICFIVFTTLFYLNSYFKVIETHIFNVLYFFILGLGNLFINLKALLFSVEIYKIEDLERFPQFDCIELDAFLFDPDLIYNQNDPYDREFVKFKIYYNNFYAYAGNIYYGGKKYAFWDINAYAKEQNIKMNALSNDDFKLIDMINI